ncbi:MAG: hypothetical protein H7288_13645 [Kineosporiaceae bacterium]|nr:hypothetical protein [Aeromicrobium sp.]
MKKLYLIGSMALAISATALSLAAASQGEEAPAPDRTPDTGTNVSHLISSLKGGTNITADDQRAVGSLTDKIAGANDNPSTDSLDFAKARVITDNSEQGRWVLVPSKEGGGYCLRIQLPDRIVPGHDTVTCAPGVDTQGYVAGLIQGSELDSKVILGITTDAVKSITIAAKNGETTELNPSNNVFVITGPTANSADRLTFVEGEGASTFSVPSDN